MLICRQCLGMLPDHVFGHLHPAGTHPAADVLERDIDVNLQRVEERLSGTDHRLDSQFRQRDRRLRSPFEQVKHTSRHNEREVIFCSECFYCIWQDGKKVTKLENTVVEVNGWWCWLQRFNVDHQSGRPTYTTFTDGRRSMSLQLNASGFDPRDIRVLVDRNQLLIDATHSESHSSRDVTSGYTSDVTRRRLSRRYLLLGHVRASDVHCRLTSDGTVIIECQVCSPGNNNVTSPGDKSRSSKQVQFDLSLL